MFRGLPDILSLVEIGAVLKSFVDFIDGDRFAIELEFEAVHGGRLFGLGGDAVRDEFRIRHGPFGRVEQNLFELADGDRLQLRLFFQ